MIAKRFRHSRIWRCAAAIISLCIFETYAQSQFSMTGSKEFFPPKSINQMPSQAAGEAYQIKIHQDKWMSQSKDPWLLKLLENLTTEVERLQERVAQLEESRKEKP